MSEPDQNRRNRLSATSADKTGVAGRPLHDASAWVITDDKMGNIVQASGVAEALGATWVHKCVRPSGIWRVAAPWGPVAPSEAFGRPGSDFAAPWPTIAIGTGRAAVPYLRALKRHAGLATYTVMLLDPRSGLGTADLIWVPAHDRLRGFNVVTTLTAPHRYSAEKMARLRADLPDQITSLASPRVAVVLGGNSKVHSFDGADDARFERALGALAARGCSFMITPSRRSHQGLIDAALRATEGCQRIFWDGVGENPYPTFLAGADVLVVTADSVNMCGEACATGKPVYVFKPSGGSAKFDRFHERLVAHGATRELAENRDMALQWSYEPLFSAQVIASHIERRYATRQSNLGVRGD